MRLLSSVYVLLAAWLILLGGLGAGLSYVLMQPPPPPSAEPATAYMPLPDPAIRNPTQMQDLAQPLDPENTQAAEAGSPSENAGETGQEASEEAGDTESAAGEPVETAEPAEQAAAAETPEPAPAPTEAAETAEPAPETESSSQTVAIPLPKPEPPAAAVSGEQTVTLDQPNDSGGEETQQPEAGAAAPEDETTTSLVTTDDQALQVPIVPPAPEDLPYWERYRQPFNTEDPRPRIAVVLTGLGLSDAATQAAIDNLPAAITLSFSPYARDLERWIALARARGHEVMLDLPMEPTTFPNDDPGPQALLTGLSAEDNLDRLDWVLSRGSAYVGVAGAMGSRFTTSRQQMETVLKELKSRGLIFLDNRTTDKSVAAAVAGEIGLKNAFNNRSIDERQASRLSIDARLAQVERIALSEGFAVAMAQPYPVTLDRLVDWSTELTARGFAIAPISALVNRQEPR